MYRKALYAGKAVKDFVVFFSQVLERKSISFFFLKKTYLPDFCHNKANNKIVEVYTGDPAQQNDAKFEEMQVQVYPEPWTSLDVRHKGS